jgi:hypothetical protein
VKQKELDINRLKTLVSMKEEDDLNSHDYEKEFEAMSERIFSL